MITQDRIKDYSLFGPRQAVVASAARAEQLGYTPSTRKTREFQFLVKREGRLVGFGRSLAVLFSRTRFSGPRASVYFFRGTRIPQFKLAKRSFLLSALVHASFITALVYLHNAMPDASAEVVERVSQPEEVYFRVPLVDSKDLFAHTQPEKPPIQSSTTDAPDATRQQPKADAPTTPSAASSGGLTIVSRPARPDNFHQTIIQPLSAPDLKIPYDVKIPNMVLLMGKAPDPAKPGFSMNPSESKPTEVNRQSPAAEAPTVPAAQAPAVLHVDTPDLAKPAFAMAPANSKAIQADRHVTSVDAPKIVAAQATTLPLNTPDVANPAFAASPSLAKAVQNRPQRASVDAPNLAPSAPSAVLPVGKPTDVPKPSFAMSPSAAKAVQVNKQFAVTDAPSVNVVQAAPNAILPLANSQDIAKPAFSMAPSNSKAVQTTPRVATTEAPIMTPSQPPASVSPVSGQGRPQAQLPIPGGTLSAPISTKSTDSGQAGPLGMPVLASSTPTYGLVAIGIDPAEPGPEVKLPPGNRYGDFVISPDGNQSGSNAKAGAATTRSDAANSVSAVPAAANSGAGPGKQSVEGSLSITGPAGTSDTSGLLKALGASVIYPVPMDVMPKIRKSQLVVSAGPMGGGGLNVYGTMQCGRIYTVFLEMPGANWTLEYCEAKPPREATPSDTSHAQSTVIHLEAPLAPPEVQARFDFQRVPVPSDKADKLILLKGVLREDGSVDKVEVFQGIVPQMDEAARLALSQWKFKPVLQGGKPIQVNILVGIPPRMAPGSLNSSSMPAAGAGATSNSVGNPKP